LHSLLHAANLESPKGWSVVVSFAGMEFSEGVWGGVVPHDGAELMAIGTPMNSRDDSLRVKLFLANPVAYFAQQRQRLWGFTALLIAAAGASVVGFFSARRAFLRARQLSEMKSNFVSSVSHELRAPLASVRLMAENLERGKVAEEAKQREYFRFIVQECRRLGALVENVLDFARIEQGRKEYDFEPTDIGALVGQTAKLMKPAAGEKQVTLLIDAARRSIELPLGTNNEIANEGQPESVLGSPLLDASAIQQALINLLDNAIKHSPAGATVVVSLTPPTPSATTGNSHASRFTLYVQDSGPGIPREEHEKIFQRFYCCGLEMRCETQGVGIGLSIVKHIAEAHGGRVVIESEVGKGSRFAIELPVKPGKRVE
jgi:signal transduction histidine kinase